MADLNKKGEKLEPGMYNCVMTGKSSGAEKDEERVYHSSTAATLRDKGHLKVESKVKKYVPKGAVV